MAAMLAEMLQESGRFDVCLCAMYKPIAVYFSAAGVSIRSLEIETAQGFWGRILNYYRKLSRLHELKKKLGMDLTISSLWPTDWVNVLTGKDRKIAIIQINILNNIQNVQMARFSKLVQYVYNRFDRVVLGSASQIPELTETFGIRSSQLTVIPNSIDIGLIDANIQAPLSPSMARLFENYHVLVAANRLHETKNTQSLIPVFKNIQDRSNVKLLIIGEGDEEENLKEEIRKEELRYSRIGDPDFDDTADVYLLGFQKNIHNLIHRSKLFLFPTRSEGTPLALLEALYCGTPVLASDCPNGGVFETMQGSGTYDRRQERTRSEQTKAGYLLPIPERHRPGSIEMWSRQVTELLNADTHTLRAMGAGGRAIARAYDKALIRSKWLESIDSVLPNK